MIQHLNLSALYTMHLDDSPNEGVSLVLEYPDLLNGSKVRERLLEQLLREAVDDAAAVHRAVRRTRLIVHLVERQRLRVGCKMK